MTGNTVVQHSWKEKVFQSENLTSHHPKIPKTSQELRMLSPLIVFVMVSKVTGVQDRSVKVFSKGKVHKKKGKQS